jgi:hypothetical protein
MILGRLWNAMTVGYSAALRAYFDPSASGSASRDARHAEYALLWDYYQNKVFDRAYDTLYSRYKTDQKLYPYMRSIFNPTRRLVNFYKGSIYPGAVSYDGRDLAPGLPQALPFADATPDELRLAASTVWRWSNLQTTLGVYTGYGAALGDVGLELVDEPEASKVLLQVRYPGHVAEMERDDEGNVQYYALEYSVEERGRGRDASTETYTYRRECDAREYRYFRDGQPYDYGEGATHPNIYGFVPFVWVQHEDMGGDRGAPAIAGSIGKIDALNDLMSRLLKSIQIDAEAPRGIATDSQLQPALSEQAQTMLDAAEISLRLLAGKAGTSSFDLGSAVDLSASLEYVREIQKEIERDHPELTMYEQMSEMSQLTGPAAARLLGHVQSLVTRAAANYDHGLVRATQMAISMAAIRRERREWAMDGDAQRAFAAFRSDSWDKGDLFFDIEPRPLISETPDERWASETARAGVAKAWTENSGSRVFGFSRAGITPDEIAAFFEANAEAIRADQLLGQSDLDPDGNPPPEQ